MRVIINADDCGINAKVNQHIEQAINKGKITSTTIMANMDDVEGALAMYEKYHNFISFGIHLNLTEGVPLLKSRVLSDYGFYAEKDGEILFDSNRAESFRYRRLPSNIKSELYKELSAQIAKLQKGGVKISHIDSHHHIHTCFSLMGVIAELSKDYDIPKVRNIRNYVPTSLSYFGRRAWKYMSKLNNSQYIMTDFFAIYCEYFNNPDVRKIKDGLTLELMIHPGNPGESYQHEERMMLGMTYPEYFQLINYNDL